MKQRFVRRCGLLVVATLVAAMSAAACTVPAKPKPTITWGFTNLMPGPGPGISVGYNATYKYRTKNVPADASIYLQKATFVGTVVKWTTLDNPETWFTGTKTIIRPPFGRIAYRLLVLDARDKLLTSAVHNLDVYKTLSFSDLTGLPSRTTTLVGGTQEFKYDYQSSIRLDHTSCRALRGLYVLNKGTQPRTLQISHIIGGKNTPKNYTFAPSIPNSYGGFSRSTTTGRSPRARTCSFTSWTTGSTGTRSTGAAARCASPIRGASEPLHPTGDQMSVTDTWNRR